MTLDILKAGHTTLGFLLSSRALNRLCSWRLETGRGRHLGNKRAASAGGGGGGIQATRCARPPRSRSPPGPAGWQPRGRGWRGRWKSTEAPLKGARTFPAPSPRPRHPVKLKWEAVSPFYLRRGNKLQLEVSSQGRPSLLFGKCVGMNRFPHYQDITPKP